jgi:hypothetical protein
MERSTDSFMKSSESFLPDINMRPNSKKKLILPKTNITSLASTIKS